MQDERDSLKLWNRTLKTIELLTQDITLLTTTPQRLDDSLCDITTVEPGVCY